MKTKYYIIGAVIIILIVIWLLFRTQIYSWFKPKTATAPAPKQVIVAAPVETGLDYNRVLKNGVYNSREVAQLQEWLGNLAIDGDFGPLTEAALRSRIHFSETTLASFQQLVSQESDNDLSNLQSTQDNSIFQPFSGFSLNYLTS